MVREGDIFRELENDFESTFARELIPGILHNFANPLNGIMGRSKLLQRRVEDNIKKTVEHFPEAGKRFVEDYGKITKDVELMISEADRLIEMFRSVSGKFYAIGDTTVQKLNLSEMVENEMKFSDFYLDFKHQVKKTGQSGSRGSGNLGGPGGPDAFSHHAYPLLHGGHEDEQGQGNFHFHVRRARAGGPEGAGHGFTAPARTERVPDEGGGCADGKPRGRQETRPGLFPAQKISGRHRGVSGRFKKCLCRPDPRSTCSGQKGLRGRWKAGTRKTMTR